MARDQRTPHGQTVPGDAIKAGVKAGRDSADRGETDREQLTAAIMAAIDAGAASGTDDNRESVPLLDTIDKEWRANPPHNRCYRYYYDSDGDDRYTCTREDDHESSDSKGQRYHVAHQSDGRVVAVWGDIDN